MQNRAVLIKAIGLALSKFLTIGAFWLLPAASVRANSVQMFVPPSLREHILKYQGVKPVWGGPNCWNLALSATGIIPALRNSTAEEMTFYMSSPLCRRRNYNEKPQPGDIGTIRQKSNTDSKTREVHGFIFISEDLVYSKAGSRPWDPPFALQSAQDIERQFVTSETETGYFQCQSMQKYFEQHLELPAELTLASRTLDRFEEHLQIQSFEATRLSPLAKEIWFNFSSELKDSFASTQNTKPPAEASEFVLNAIRTRLQSISNHLLVTSFDSDFATEIDKVRAELDLAVH